MTSAADALTALAGDVGWREVAAAVLGVDEIWSNLVTLSQLAERRGVALGTAGSWVERMPDWPKPVPDPYGGQRRWWWPDVLAYLDLNDLPRFRREAGRPTPASIPADEMTAAAWADPGGREAAIRYWLERRSANTRRLWLGHIDEWFAWCDRRGIDPGNPARTDVSGWRRSLAARRLGHHAIDLRMTAVSDFYDFWSARGVVTVNPVRPVKPRRVTAGDRARQVVTDDS